MKEIDTLKKAEKEKGELDRVLVSIFMDIKICYRDKTEEFKLESNKSVHDLHEEIAKRLIPKESQKLIFKVGEEER